MTTLAEDTAWWLLAGASERGSGHCRDGKPNQDYWSRRVVKTLFAEETLILAAADGAGSASHSADGAEFAVESSLDELVRRIIKNPASLIKPHLMRSRLHKAVGSSRDRIRRRAKTDNLEFRDLACTLLIAVVSDSMLATAHIGDGAIITKSGEGQYNTVSPPQSGEFSNETFFITSKEKPKPVIKISRNPSVSALFLITDGLQPLAISNQSHVAHPGFFDPIAETILSDGDIDLSAERIKEFIKSERVKQRTLDDVTLVAAVAKRESC